MWTHTKYKTKFKGTYERDSKGERVFILTGKGKSTKRITFESWQMAKKIGWKK
jgi:hypothetical protein